MAASDTVYDENSLLQDPIISSQQFTSEMTGDVSENGDQYDHFDFDNLFDVLCSTDPSDMRRHGLIEESIYLLSSPENEKSKKIYERHQKTYLDYASSVNCDAFKEERLVNYVSATYEGGRYSPGSFWCMFSCIRSYIVIKTKVDIKTFTLLKGLIKRLTVNHLKINRTFYWRRNH